MSHVFRTSRWPCQPAVRRSLAILLALALAEPSLGRAAQPARADFNREIDALMERKEYREAAIRLARELKQLPETQANRIRRNVLASLAVNAYLAAFRAAPNDCTLACSGLVVADEYLDGLVSAYGEGARSSDEYQGMSGLQSEFDPVCVERSCRAPEASPPQGAAAPPPAPQTDSRAKHAERPLIAGIAVSASLAAAGLAVAIGVSTTYRKPGGPLYEDILKAAKASDADGDPNNNVAWNDGSDMCTLEARGKNDDVKDACAKAFAYQGGSIGAGVAAGVLGVTAIALIAVLVKKRRNASNAAALLRRHEATLGVSPVGRGGLNVNLGFSF